MSGRLLATSLAGFIGGVCVSALPAAAADVAAKGASAPPAVAAYALPAVDGFNWKIEGFGGSVDDRGLYGAGASFSMPLAPSFGLQVDVTAAGLDGDFIGGGAGHWFWRDPSRGMFGLYGAGSYWDHAGGINANHFGAEAGWYLDRWSIEGVAGVEWGNSGSAINGTTIETFDIKTRFFDQIDLAFYVNDNFKLFVGHRYLGGENFAAVGGEWGIPTGGGTMAALFAEGRFSGDVTGVWGGLRFYVGQKDKSLIARHRQDDPPKWGNDSPESFTGSKKEHKKKNEKCEPPPGAGAIPCDTAKGGGGKAGAAPSCCPVG